MFKVSLILYIPLVKEVTYKSGIKFDVNIIFKCTECNKKNFHGGKTAYKLPRARHVTEAHFLEQRGEH